MATRSLHRDTQPDLPLDPKLLRRVVVDDVRPSVDGGQFPIKRVPGEVVRVTADVYADGHDRLAAAVLYRRSGEHSWRESPMRVLDNDRWVGQFVVDELGIYEYTVEAWVDRFESWRREVSKKSDAGQDVSSELLEGATLIEEALGRARERQGEQDVRERRVRQVQGIAESLRPLDALRQAAAGLRDTGRTQNERLETALSAHVQRAVAAYPDRARATRMDTVLEVAVDRERARFGAWYEMFPRSATPDPTRVATFDEAASMLAYVASLGFDVLYLPPIHPIGRTFRKGRNNTLQPAPGDPGSPWAIGAAEGGHTAIDPGLGTIDDFGRFVERARGLGLEIALDIAFQASPDHPYVGEHPEWFCQRPDGTIKYAENPPKKYQDIYPINFESDDWVALWHELKGVIEFWIDHGVRIFRVDNPHTKPFRFWEWALGEIRRAHPDTIFLAEAFTRPKVMRHLAKCGFNQSYTYFTWRNSKAEITEYFTELTQTDVREYMRPNLFANTPDILHEYLQRGGRPAFQVRLVLAATLGASYGIYSGFELAENTPVREGSEEYLDSEKYQVRPRDFSRRDSLAELIARMNEIRRQHPALQRDWGLRFHDTDNPELICYSKHSAGGTDVVLVVVNLDPFHMQHGFIRLPLTAWGIQAGTTVELADLLSGERYFWRSEWNYVRLDPESRVAHVLHVRLPAPIPIDSEVPLD